MIHGDDTTARQEALEREAALMTMKYVRGDLDSVQQMEQSMMQITALLAQFANLVTEQQESVQDIHQKTGAAKENVSKGQEELIKAKDRTVQSSHYTATAIFVLTLVLLLFHELRP